MNTITILNLRKMNQRMTMMGDGYFWDDDDMFDDDDDSALNWCTSCCDNKATYNGLCDDCREEEE